MLLDTGNSAVHTVANTDRRQNGHGNMQQ